MAQIMFIAEVPKNAALSTASGHSIEWQSFEAELKGEPLPNARGKSIAQGTWLLDAGGSLPWLTKAIDIAKRNGVSCKLFLIEGTVTEMSKP